MNIINNPVSHDYVSHDYSFTYVALNMSQLSASEARAKVIESAVKLLLCPLCVTNPYVQYVTRVTWLRGHSINMYW